MTRTDYSWLFWSSAFMVVWALIVPRVFAEPEDSREGKRTGGAGASEEERPTYRDRRPEIRLVLWGFCLNLVWELAQSPLYADHPNDWRYIVRTRLHCTFGDVLILLGAFWATAACFRSRVWPQTHGAAAVSLFVGLGLVYTAWSEWFNTTVREAWTYTPTMPQVFGIGLSPLLQWLVLPTLLVLILRQERENALRKGRTA